MNSAIYCQLYQNDKNKEKDDGNGPNKKTCHPSYTDKIQNTDSLGSKWSPKRNVIGASFTD